MKLILILSVLLAACQSRAPVNQTTKPSPAVAVNIGSNNAAATPAPTVADKTKIRNFRGTGKVTKINLELVSVELDHEEIKGLMPKMIMEFYVKEKSELERLKVGDAVDFVLEDNAGAERIIEIKRK